MSYDDWKCTDTTPEPPPACTRCHDDGCPECTELPVCETCADDRIITNGAGETIGKCPDCTRSVWGEDDCNDRS